jgi:hypothetical protein
MESVELLGPVGTPTGHLTAGHPATVRVRARALRAVDDLVVASTLFGPDGTAIYADSSAGHPFGPVEAGSEFSWTMDFRSQLPTGSYQISVRIDRADLRTTLAHFPPVSFFVTGRQTVSGVADLEAVFTRDDGLRLPDAFASARAADGDASL